MLTLTRPTTVIIRPTTTGCTERKPACRKPKVHWFERNMRLSDLIGTAGNPKFDDLANRLAGK